MIFPFYFKVQVPYFHNDSKRSECDNSDIVASSTDTDSINFQQI